MKFVILGEKAASNVMDGNNSWFLLVAFDHSERFTKTEFSIWKVSDCLF